MKLYLDLWAAAFDRRDLSHAAKDSILQQAKDKISQQR
jgi:hypothetical protein